KAARAILSCRMLLKVAPNRLSGERTEQDHPPAGPSALRREWRYFTETTEDRKSRRAPEPRRQNGGGRKANPAPLAENHGHRNLPGSDLPFRKASNYREPGGTESRLAGAEGQWTAAGWEEIFPGRPEGRPGLHPRP